MKEPGCIVCGAELTLDEVEGSYGWGCGRGCGTGVRTGVPAAVDISAFEEVGFPKGNLDAAFFTKPLAANLIEGAKVYMPFILYHFIGCGWGPCYMSLYRHVIVPHLDDVTVLDYVLRSPVVSDPTAGHTDGVSDPKMYSELFTYLSRVKSVEVREYLSETFGHRFGAQT